LSDPLPGHGTLPGLAYQDRSPAGKAGLLSCFSRF